MGRLVVNKIIDVSVDMNLGSREKPSIFVLFDKIDTSELVFDTAPATSPMSHPYETGKNLLATDHDLAVFYYFSEANQHGPHRVSLKHRDGEVYNYPGLWSSNSDAINLWFPETTVVEVKATDNKDSFLSKKVSCSQINAVADTVIRCLKEKTWRVGVVKDIDGYASIQPLLPDATAKNEYLGAKVIKVF
jgi:hypothetical protein